MGIQAQIYAEGVCNELLAYDKKLREADTSDSERLFALLAKIESIRKSAEAGWY